MAGYCVSAMIRGSRSACGRLQRMTMPPAAVLRLLALLPLTVALLACSSQPSKPPAASSADMATVEPVTITWSFWGDDWELAINERMVRAFERDYPQIKVRVEHRPWGQYFSWLRDEWRAGRSPDVAFLNYIPSYVALGELEPLDRFVAADSAQLND